MMQRLTQFDVSRQFVSARGKYTAQFVFGGVCAAAMIGFRSLLDIWAPTAGPFALVYPTVLLSTLYGHWRAGIVALVTCFFWAWFVVLPAPMSFDFQVASDPSRVIINAFACLIVMIFAEAFRRAASNNMQQISQMADRRLTLLAEMEHRTKNNFALVASMLEIQKRRLSSRDLDGPLDDAVGRVRTFADAYSSLAGEQEEGNEVDMKPYLEQLLDRIERAALDNAITLHRNIDDVRLPRETGVAIGLYLNEALSNCAKYAFPEGSPGNIIVAFDANGEEWSLSVEDDGAGVHSSVSTSTGLGTQLMAAFASQAGAAHRSEAGDRGYMTRLTSADE